MAKKKLPQIDRDACIGCSACVSACPVSALDMDGDKAKLVKPVECTSCGACVDSCPVSAISMAEKDI